MTKEEIIKEKKLKKKLIITAFIGIIVSIINIVLSQNNWSVMVISLYFAVCFLIVIFFNYRDYKKL